MHPTKTAILIGNSDGIGLQTTYLLLSLGYKIIGLSRSPITINHVNYQHIIQDVTDDTFRLVLNDLVSSISTADLCIYFAGIGEFIDLTNIKTQTAVFSVNLLGAVIAVEIIITKMLKQNHGHFIGLSSVMDSTISPHAPSYSASKASLSLYLEGLAHALIDKNVKISNIRFGFVDTKMAKSPYRPWLLTAEDAARFIHKIINKPRIRATKPLIMGFTIWLYSLKIRLRLLFN